MNFELVQNRLETIEGELLKTGVEFAIHCLAKYEFGNRILELASGGERVESNKLHVNVGGLQFESPVMVGAGWDERGWAVDGLYALGFAGTEVGTVMVHPQSGNPRPRLFYRDGVGLNRLGFNSIGMEGVADNLDKQARPGVLGISLGKNKLTPDDQAPWAHAEVARRLHEYADYFVINVASPNMPGMRDLLNPKPLSEIVLAVQKVLKELGDKPLFVKTTVDLSLEDLDKVIDVCIAYGVTGIIDTNTTIDEELKSQYGWQGEAGGLSGDNLVFRKRADARMRHITRTTRGTGLQRIGVGAINDPESAIERIQSGAQVVQVVTGIRQKKGRIAGDINVGILDRLDDLHVDSVRDIVGIAA